MLPQKSSQLTFHLAEKSLALNFGSQDAFQPHSARLFPSRVRKTQHQSPQKKLKVLKMIQGFQQFQSQQQQKERAKAQSRRLLSEKHKLNAYMSYKRDQQVMKLQHCAKITYLKSRCMQSRDNSFIKSNERSRSVTLSPRSQTKPGMSKISLVLASEKGDKNTKPHLKSRQFQHLKTWEGKRQKISSTEYQSRLRSRMSSYSEQRPHTSEVIKTRISDYNNTPFFCTLNEVTTKQSSKAFKHSKNKSNRVLGLQRQAADCRPWTSCNSQEDE